MDDVLDDVQVPKIRAVKRKPPPKLDLEQRYPSPDPTDPFAPLSVLRSRSSALSPTQSSQPSSPRTSVPTKRASFQLFPAPPLNLDGQLPARRGGRDFDGSIELAGSTLKPFGEAHYRTRSNSAMGVHRYSVKLHELAQLEQAISFNRDVNNDSSGTDDAEYDKQLDLKLRATSHGQVFSIPRSTLQKKPSQMSLDSSFSRASSTSRRRAKLSLSPRYLFSQTSLISPPGSPSTMSSNSRHTRDPSHPSDEESIEADHDSPELHRRLKHSLGSGFTKCTVVSDVFVLPSTPLTPNVPTAIPERSAPASNNSSFYTSSFVNVSTPSFGHLSTKSNVVAPTPLPASRNYHTAIIQPSAVLSAPTSPVTTEPPTTGRHKFRFRRPSTASAKLAGSPRKPKISNPTLVSPPPTIATRELSNTTIVQGPVPPIPAPAPVSIEQPAIPTEIPAAATSPSTPTNSAGSILPSSSQLIRAASLPLITESGVRTNFSSLFSREAATIVIFIRHFWCPFDQDYVQDLVEVVRYNGITQSKDDIQLVIVGHGSHTLIHKYRQMFKMPESVRVLTDPTRQLYEMLGMKMIREGSEKGNTPSSKYVKRGKLVGIATVVLRALRVGMPVWEKGGDAGQLGGEFVFKDRTSCTFAHRMQTKNDHVSISDIIQAASHSSSPIKSTFPESSSSPPSSKPTDGYASTSGLRSPPPQHQILNHPYAHGDSGHHCPSQTLPNTTLPLTHEKPRRRTASLTSPKGADARAAARKARVRASTIWSMDVKDYEDGNPDEETERWKRNLICLRAGLENAV